MKKLMDVLPLLLVVVLLFGTACQSNKKDLQSAWRSLLHGECFIGIIPDKFPEVIDDVFTQENGTQ
jgi:hypothetical protein